MHGVKMKRTGAKIDYSKKIFTKYEKMIMKNEVFSINMSYPYHIPILVRVQSEKIKLSKYKYLIGDEMTMAQFLYVIRQKMLVPLSSSDSLFAFVNDTIPPNSALFGQLYKEYKDPETDMLIITLCNENTFGHIKK